MRGLPGDILLGRGLSWVFSSWLPPWASLSLAEEYIFAAGERPRRQRPVRTGRDGFGWRKTRVAGGRPAGARRLVRISAFDGLSWRLQPKRLELLGPVARQVG